MEDTMTDPPLQSYLRFIAIDIHKHYLMIGGIDAHKRVVLQPRRVELTRWPQWAQTNLLSTDAVVIEATTNVWAIYDLLAPLVGRAVVVHPAKVKLIAASRVKTDKVDVLSLAHLLRADLLPEVWVPPQHVRDLRALLSHRRRLVSLQTTAKNRLQSVLHRLNLRAPEGDAFAHKHRAWWAELTLSATERLRVDQDVATLDHVAVQIAAIDVELRTLSTSEPWAEQVPYLIQVPGIALLSAMTILGAVGDITRFATAKKLVGYAGLGAGVHESGKTHRDKGITKQGRRELRYVMIEAARAASQSHWYWKREFAQLERRIGEAKAIVAIARKLLIVVWHVLLAKSADRRADDEQVAFKLMVWSWKLTDQQRGGLTTRQFIRAHLIRLGLGKDLRHITRGGIKRGVATIEEVLELRPELRGPPGEEALEEMN
jgi:transposase